MRIGFDITALYVAQAGVFKYDLCLLQALLEQDPGGEYVLLDYRPLRDRRASLPEIAHLEAPNAQIVHCDGLRYRRLARWERLQTPALRQLATLVDRVVLWPWSVAAKAVMHRRLAQALDGVDAFRTSDVLLWRQPGALNVVTIYDLTALLLPGCHTASTRELQLAKYRFAQREANIVIATSEATKRDIVAHLGIPAERVRVVYGGVSPAFHPIMDRQTLEQALGPLGLVPGSYILYVGTIEPRKNLVRLVEAYHQVREMASPPVPRLVLAGAEGWLSREVFGRVEALELGGEVLFLGRAPAGVLPSLYSGAVLFVYPSLYEGFGLPPLEAMACGAPVVTSNTSSLPEVVGDAGALVQPMDVQALADVLCSLLGDAEQRARLSARGVARARGFSWGRAARETLAIFGQAAGA